MNTDLTEMNSTASSNIDKKTDLLQLVLAAFGLPGEQLSIAAFGNGLINHTWKVLAGDTAYILQKINHRVFKEPGAIAENIDLLAHHLRTHFPGYYFAAPLYSTAGKPVVHILHEGFFRLYPFVEGAQSHDVVQTPHQAYEAARQFGKFTSLLSRFEIGRLKTTIPSFHDLTLRYSQFLQSLQTGNPHRKLQAGDSIEKLLGWSYIAEEYRHIKQSPRFKLRVTHHDTKISNVLFNENGAALCVIDLDTVMPGYFISDVGDMIRTYLSPANEEETDFDKITIRTHFFEEIIRGYYTEMKSELTDEEKQHFFYAGLFMIYMQALRFITDYLNDDVYYGERFSGHNLKRAANQVSLLQKYLEEKDTLEAIIKNIVD